MHGGNGHGHGHNHEQAKGPDKLLAVMTYMLEHNRSHADELANIANKLENDGKAEAAALLREGVVLLGQGNEKLAAALSLISG